MQPASEIAMPVHDAHDLDVIAGPAIEDHVFRVNDRAETAAEFLSCPADLGVIGDEVEARFDPFEKGTARNGACRAIQSPMPRRSASASGEMTTRFTRRAAHASRR